MLERASSLRPTGPYQLQAAIAAVHCRAERAADTDWRRSRALYEQLGAARALARGRAQPRGRRRDGRGAGARARAHRRPRGPRALPLPPLDARRPPPPTRATGRRGDAYRRALELTTNGAERAFLERRLREIDRAVGAGAPVVEEAHGDRTQGTRRRPHPRRRVRGRLRRTPAAQRLDRRQPRELHALHADAAGGRVGNARAPSRRRPAAPDVPEGRAAARPRYRPRRGAPRRDRARRRSGEFDVEYEQLVVALGSVVRVLPVPGLAEHAYGFKDLPDAIQLRNHVLRELEAADAALDEEQARRHLSFVFVGAGYAGVEALAELRDLVEAALRYYPRLRPLPRRWVLVDAAPDDPPRASPAGSASTPPATSRSAGSRSASGRPSTRSTPRPRTSRTARRSRRTRWSGRPACVRTRSSRRARAPGRRQGPVILSTRRCGSRAASGSGRSATARACRTSPHPARTTRPTSQHALRQARRLARNLGGEAKPYRYRMLGQVATLGHYKGIADVLGLRLTGFLGWFVTRTLPPVPAAAAEPEAAGRGGLDGRALLPPGHRGARRPRPAAGAAR